MDVSFDDDEPFIFRLNDNGSGPSLLVKVCAERGWRMYQGTGLEERWNLWWKTSAFPSASYKTLGDWQFMNHIPKGGSICRKDNLSRLLRCMKRIYGAIYEFSPPCYHLPLEYAKLVSECSRLRRDEEAGANVVWIHKPVAQSQGRGIFLFRIEKLMMPVFISWRIFTETLVKAYNYLELAYKSLDGLSSVCEMNCGASAVVQRYIERPLLIAGYKFDLRLYVCVAGYRPLTAYMYAEGLARFGTDKYTLSDIHNPYRHLTNSSLNKSGPRYAECKDRIGSGCKWTLTQVRKALIGRWGAAEWVMWQRIRALVTLTLLAQAAGTPPARNCFEFYGFDVLLDDALRPWLLEVNLSPALATDCEADIVVKQPMLHELFDLLGMPMKHTGLAKLKAPPMPLASQNSCSSEDEGGGGGGGGAGAAGGGGGGGGGGRGRERAAAARRGGRWRRRRALPLHCVTLQGPGSQHTAPPAAQPTPDKPNESSEKSKEPHSGRYKTNETGDNADTQSTSSVSIQPAESVDESWRGGYSTAASRRRAMTACQWGNGVRWNQATGRVGHWVRIYPHSLPTGDDLPMEDVRESVAQVTKLVRAAREVSRECARDGAAPRDAARDAVFEAALREKLSDFGPHFQVWLPPF